MDNSNNTASQTLDLLEERLRRIDIILHGDQPRRRTDSPLAEDGLPATIRLRNLERGMQMLAHKSPAVFEILALHKQSPELFGHTSPSEETILPSTMVASLVLAHSNIYRSLASQLSQLQEIKIPDQLPSTTLIGQRERIDKVRAKQLSQAEELADLRARSALIVEKWYKGGVLEMGDCWADWEERLRDVEILVRRREAAKRRDEEIV